MLDIQTVVYELLKDSAPSVAAELTRKPNPDPLVQPPGPFNSTAGRVWLLIGFISGALLLILSNLPQD